MSALPPEVHASRGLHKPNMSLVPENRESRLRRSSSGRSPISRVPRRAHQGMVEPEPTDPLALLRSVEIQARQWRNEGPGQSQPGTGAIRSASGALSRGPSSRSEPQRSARRRLRPNAQAPYRGRAKSDSMRELHPVGHVAATGGGEGEATETDDAGRRRAARGGRTVNDLKRNHDGLDSRYGVECARTRGGAGSR